jgi:hypothetical protein
MFSHGRWSTSQADALGDSRPVTEQGTKHGGYNQYACEQKEPVEPANNALPEEPAAAGPMERCQAHGEVARCMRRHQGPSPGNANRTGPVSHPCPHNAFHCEHPVCAATATQQGAHVTCPAPPESWTSVPPRWSHNQTGPGQLQALDVGLQQTHPGHCRRNVTAITGAWWCLNRETRYNLAITKRFVPVQLCRSGCETIDVVPHCTSPLPVETRHWIARETNEHMTGMTAMSDSRCTGQQGPCIPRRVHQPTHVSCPRRRCSW